MVNEIGMNYEIYTMNADGTGILRITYNGADDAEPSWSALTN